MLKRKTKRYLELSDVELRLVRRSLLRVHNKVVAAGRCADPVDELLLRLAALN